MTPSRQHSHTYLWPPRAPLRTPLVKPAHPKLGSAVEAAFGENDQTALRIVALLKSALQQRIKPLTDLFCRRLNGGVAPAIAGLFHSSRKKDAALCR